MIIWGMIEPVYRQAEKEWVDYVDRLMEKVTELDDEVPPLPAKDAIHRIYRDVREVFHSNWLQSS